MNVKKKAVGIQLLGKNTNGELVAILQVRAKWNTEKNAPESWPGACQVTVHGKLEKGEDFMQALLREVAEELDEEIASIVQKLSKDGKLKELINYDISEKQIITYGAIVSEDVLQTLVKKEKSDSFGGFRIIKRDEVEKIVDIQKFDKTLGVIDKNVIAMFPDEKEIVRLAFKKLA